MAMIWQAAKREMVLRTNGFVMFLSLFSSGTICRDCREAGADAKPLRTQRNDEVWPISASCVRSPEA